ncbi:MAG: hypothetical protein DRP54_02980 [Spirochaetes bacterium]|nr:MAG: hypothetical protein DRP54_02980 [Spirochaetota bacterium]
MTGTLNTDKDDIEQIKILIIDDDELVIESFEKAFQSVGESLLFEKTTSSVKGLNLIENNEYDLVITDIVMPEIDGINILKKVKERSPDTEVIIITAFSSYNTALDAMHFGAFDYIPKPFNPAELRVRIMRAINKRKAVKEKIQKVKETERLCTSLAHDFKSVLVSIKGFANLLIQNYSNKLNDEGRFILERIISNVNVMEAMVHGLLEYSRAGGMIKTYETINTEEILDSIIRGFAHRLKEKNVEVIVDKPLPNVYFYRNGLIQVFTNLIDNAIKYSRKDVKGIIRISAKSGIGFSGRPQYIFSISDNGIGIPKEFLPRIFEPFQKGNPEDSESYGLGLAIVKKILDSANCSIEVDSELEKGTTFSFSLPAPPVNS